VYSKVPPPQSDADRKACTGSVQDSCSTSPPCPAGNSFNWSGLVGTNAPTIAPGKSMVIYTGGYGTSSAGKPFRLGIKTKTLQ
jgi:hypothetical protein